MVLPHAFTGAHREQPVRLKGRIAMYMDLFHSPMVVSLFETVRLQSKYTGYR